MASLFDNFKRLVTKNSQATNQLFNRAIYNFLGDTIITSAENDDSYINKGYRFNSTVYSIVNLITKAASTVPFQVYEVQSQNSLKRYKALTSNGFDANATHKAQVILKNEIYKMRPLKKPLSILSGNELILKPKSFHIMFYNIKKSHVADELLTAKILFNRDIEIEVKFKVLIGNDTHKHH